MGRKPYTNHVPVAPFSLITTGPRTTTDIYNSLGMKRYLVSRGQETDPRATIEKDPCPKCSAVVEWALTYKRVNGHPKGGECYVYARCRGDQRHSWSFRNKGEADPITPEAPKAEATPAIPDKAPLITPPPAEEIAAPVKVPQGDQDLEAMEDLANEAEAPGADGKELVAKAESLFDAIKAPVAGSIDEALKAIPALVNQAEALHTRIRALEKHSDTTDTVLEMLNATLEGVRKEIVALTKIKASVIEVHTPVAVLKVNGAHHPILDEMLERYALGERTFLLVGPAGTGKTTIAEQFMRAIGAVRFSVIPCSEDKRAAEYIGWRNMNVTTGESHYNPTALVEDLCASLDAVSGTVIEEMDASGANVMLSLNTLTNGYLATPDADMPMCPRGKDHVLVATANTFGTAGNLTYVGRNQLDGATLNRYRTLFVDYDQQLEIAITGAPEIVEHAAKVRKNLEALKMRRIWGTRDLMRLKFDLQLKANKGKTLDQVCKVLMRNQGWSADEITRALAVSI